MTAPGAGAGAALPFPLPAGLPRARSASRLSGGSICEVWSVGLEDGSRAVVKRTPYAAEVEADGLRALARAGAPVPEVLASDDDLLVLTEVGGPPDWEGLGRAIARVHHDTAEAFGYHRDNLIGPLPQDNGWDRDWAAFYAQRRLRPYLADLPHDLRDRLARALEGPLADLLGHRPAPSLLHGDLWSGNVVGGRWLIDPAVCYGDREHELAFMDLFGGFPHALTEAYTDAWPLPEGSGLRRPAYQLYHLLVHVRLFGAGYLSGVRARLDALGW